MAFIRKAAPLLLDHNPQMFRRGRRIDHNARGRLIPDRAEIPVDDLAKCNEAEITDRDGVCSASIDCLAFAIDTFWRFGRFAVVIVFVIERHDTDDGLMVDGDLGRPLVVEMGDQLGNRRRTTLDEVAEIVPEAAAGLWPRRNAPGWDVPSGKKPLPAMVAMYPTSPSATSCSLSMSAEISSFRDRSFVPGFWEEARSVQTAKTNTRLST